MATEETSPQFSFKVTTTDTMDGKETSCTVIDILNGKLQINYTGDEESIDHAYILETLLDVINTTPQFFDSLNKAGNVAICNFLKARNAKLQ